MRRRLTLAALATLTLCACTLGPDYMQPDAPMVTRYTQAAQPAATDTASGTTQRFVPARDIAGDWWTLFHAAALDALVREALAGSPTLAAAEARLAQAQALYEARDSATTGPQVGGTLGIARQKVDPSTFGFPGAPVPPPFTVYNIGISVSYTFDVFGGTRRELEALAARVDHARDERDAARRALAANVVTAALRAATLRTRGTTTAALLAAQQRQLDIVAQRHALGAVATVDVDNQRALVAQTAALLPGLASQRAAAEHALALYLGKPVADVVIPALTIADFTLPPQIPLTLPAELARQRPDIRASEALLHEAAANVGVATANLYPRFTLSGSGGSARTSFADIASGLNVWSIGLELLQPVFRAGQLQSERRAAVAAFDAARADYRQTVLAALTSVADALQALTDDASTLAARDAQRAAQDKAVAIMVGRYEIGGVSQLDLLDAQRQQLSAAIDYEAARAQRLQDTAALLAALGGGWWHAADTP